MKEFDKLDKVMNDLLEKEKEFREKTGLNIRKKRTGRDPKQWEKINAKQLKETFGEDAEKMFVPDDRLDEVMDICRENLKREIS